MRVAQIVTIGAASAAMCLGAPRGAAAAGEADAARAEGLFQEAMKLVDAGRAAEACPKLAESHRLDPGFGTLFNLADCHERTGRTASAWSAFREAAEIAKKSGEPERVAKAERRAAQLEPRLARLVVVVRVPATGLALRVDGAVLGREGWGAARPMDPGEHAVEAAAPGKRTWTGKARLDVAGKTVTVEVPALADAAPAAPAAAPGAAAQGKGGAAANEPARGEWLTMGRAVALASAGVGLAGVVVGGVFGLGAKSTWDEARAGPCDEAGHCDARGVELVNDAKDKAMVSTIGFAVGGAGLAAGAVLWVVAGPKAPPRATTGVRVLPSAGARSAGVVLGGRF